MDLLLKKEAALLRGRAVFVWFIGLVAACEIVRLMNPFRRERAVSTWTRTIADRSVAMPLDYDKLLNWRPPEVRQKLAPKDTILYALGLGLGADPTDERQLRFVYEKDLLALPTIATVLASPAFWMKAPEFGLDWHKILHGEEAFEISTPIPAEGKLIGRTRVAAIVDKGADKGALALIERTISEAQTGQTIATVKSTAFMRGDGGFGGPSGPTPELHQLPNRAPDLTCDAPTLPQAALIYRLSGDYNPLHADPEVANKAASASQFCMASVRLE